MPTMDEQADERRKCRSTHLIALAVLMILSALFFLHGLSKPPTRDEQMYCPARVPMARGSHI